jgi:hypothetical protein
MERHSKESRVLEAYCGGGQGPPRAVAPFGMDVQWTVLLITRFRIFKDNVGWNNYWNCNCTVCFLGFYIYGCNLGW